MDAAKQRYDLSFHMNARKKNGFLIIVLLHVGVKDEEVQSFTPAVQTLISSILLVYIFSDRKENEVVSRMMDKVSTWFEMVTNNCSSRLRG